MTSTIMTFEQYNESMNTTSGVANSDVKVGMMKRSEMPQISIFEDFIKDLTENGVMITTGKHSPEMFTPTQSEFNDEKVDAMIANDSFNCKPIIASNDGYVVDGHHRWKAAEKSNSELSAHTVNMSIDEIYEFLKNKDYITKKDINESLENTK